MHPIVLHEALRSELHDPIGQHGVRDLHEYCDVAAALTVATIGTGDAGRHARIREAMVDLITITESGYACGVAASAYCESGPSGSIMSNAIVPDIGAEQDAAQ